jgi:hypothetical protein
VIIRKFHDMNGNGLVDPGEPLLAGVHFEFEEGGRFHRRVTDNQGAATFCMDEPNGIVVRELARESGGQWQITTTVPDVYVLTCPARELWVGNQEVGLPKTGRGGDVCPPAQGARQEPVRLRRALGRVDVLPW